MAKMTKARARKRLREAAVKIQKVWDYSRHYAPEGLTNAQNKDFGTAIDLCLRQARKLK